MRLQLNMESLGKKLMLLNNTAEIAQLVKPFSCLISFSLSSNTTIRFCAYANQKRAAGKKIHNADIP